MKIIKLDNEELAFIKALKDMFEEDFNRLKKDGMLFNSNIEHKNGVYTLKIIVTDAKQNN